MMDGNQITQLNGMVTNLRTQSFAMQNSALNRTVFDTIKYNIQKLKAQLGNISIDDADEMRDELEDVMGLGNSISEALSREIGTPMNEGELEGEHAALMDIEDVDEEQVASKPGKMAARDEDKDELSSIVVVGLVL